MFLGLGLLGAAGLAYLLWSQQQSSGDGSSTLSNLESDFDFAPLMTGDNNLTLPSTRGFRNNNPGNLRYIAGDPWRGQTGNDGGYGVYDSLSDGVRASGKQLLKDYANGLVTLAQAIRTWAPPSENNTPAYIAEVANVTGLDPNADADVPTNYAAILDAIFIQENGSNPITQDQIVAWVNS